MRRKLLTAVLTILLTFSMAGVQPATAQGHGCRAFGQNIAFLATSFGSGFGQMAASTAPLNDTVESEQNALCS